MSHFDKKITNYKSRVNNLDEIFNGFETPTRVVRIHIVWYKNSAELPTFRTKTLQNYQNSLCVSGLLLSVRHLN